MTGTSLSLPWELIVSIIEQCFQWPGTLASITLVNGACNLEANRVLYSRLHVLADHSERPNVLQTLAKHPKKSQLVKALTVVFRRRETPRARNSWQLLFSVLVDTQNLEDLRVKGTFDKAAVMAHDLPKVLCTSPFHLKTLFVNNTLLPEVANILSHHSRISLLGIYIAREASFRQLPDGQSLQETLPTLAALHGITVLTVAFSDSRNDQEPWATTLRIFANTPGDPTSIIRVVEEALEADNCYKFFHSHYFEAVYFTSSHVIASDTEDWTLRHTNQGLLDLWSTIFNKGFLALATVIICTAHASCLSNNSPPLTQLRGATQAVIDFSPFATLGLIDIDFDFITVAQLLKRFVPAIIRVRSPYLTTLRLGFRKLRFMPNESQVVVLCAQDTFLASAELPLTKNLERFEIQTGEMGSFGWNQNFPAVAHRFNVRFLE